MGASGFGGFGGQGFNVEDFGDLFGNLGDIFGFGGAGGRRRFLSGRGAGCRPPGGDACIGRSGQRPGWGSRGMC